MKKIRIVIILFFIALSLASCNSGHIGVFGPKEKKSGSQAKSGKMQNRTVEKHSGRGGFKDSFSSKKQSHTGGGFGKDSYSARKQKHTGGGFGKDSYSARKQKHTGGGFGKDSYSARKQKHTGGGFGKDSFSARKKVHTGGGFRKDSFSARPKRTNSLNSFNKSKKRVTQRFTFIKPKDIDAGSFGHGRRSSFTKQNVFDEKTKRVKKRNGIWWDMNQSFKRKKHKKHMLELELFDPKMKNNKKVEK